MKRVSFVIPSHNCAAWLPHAVDSVLKQDYKDIEVVIVDDASEDSTGDYLKWLEEKKDSRIVIVRNAVLLGRSGARNAGNQAASGEIICVLDADDMARPIRASMTAQRFNSGAQYLYGSAVVMDAVGTILAEERADTFNLAKASETLLNRIVHSTVAYTKDIALRFPYESGEIADLGIDDWAHQLAVAHAGIRLDFTPAIISDYRQLATSVSKTRDAEKVSAAKARFLERFKVAA